MVTSLGLPCLPGRLRTRLWGLSESIHSREGYGISQTWQISVIRYLPGLNDRKIRL